MNSKLIFGIVLFLSMIAGGIYLYYRFEKPIKDSNESFTDVLIYATYGGELIKTGYKFSGFSGETLESGAIMERLRGDHEVTFSNFNLDGQDFYTFEKQINLNDNETKRVELVLEKPEELEINQMENEVGLSSKMFKNLIYCIRWTYPYIFVRIENLTEIRNPEIYKYWERCYDSGISLENSKTYVKVEYGEYGIPDDEDYIELAIIDSDRLGNGEIITSINNTDLYGYDKIIKIK